MGRAGNDVYFASEELEATGAHPGTAVLSGTVSVELKIGEWARRSGLVILSWKANQSQSFMSVAAFRESGGRRGRTKVIFLEGGSYFGNGGKEPRECVYALA